MIRQAATQRAAPSLTHDPATMDCIDRDYGAAASYFAQRTAPAPAAGSAPIAGAAGVGLRKAAETCVVVAPETVYAFDRDFAAAAAAFAQNGKQRRELDSAVDRDYSASAKELAHFRAALVSRAAVPRADQTAWGAARIGEAAVAQHVAADVAGQRVLGLARAPADDAEDRDYVRAGCELARHRREAELLDVTDRDFAAAEIAYANYRTRMDDCVDRPYGHRETPAAVAAVAQPGNAPGAPAYAGDSIDRDYTTAGREFAAQFGKPRPVCDAADRDYAAAEHERAVWLASQRQTHGAVSTPLYGEDRDFAQAEDDRARFQAKYSNDAADRSFPQAAEDLRRLRGKKTNAHLDLDLDADQGYDSLDVCREPFHNPMSGGQIDFVRRAARVMHPHVGPQRVW